ncbi:MAG: hypothetical protein KIS92_15830 [Planctomycetota bacterium]|nr:hypothetical protein [Planctomycetota bacterium]
MNARNRAAVLCLLTLSVLSRAWSEEPAEDKPEIEKAAKPGKWDAAFAAFEKQDKEQPPPKDPLLLVGSSSFTRWKSAGKDLAPLPVINRGFGGSTMSAVLENYAKLVPPYHPKTIVVYEGSNDIAGGKKPAQVLEEFKAFVEKVNKDLPDTKIVILSVHLPPVRAKHFDAYRELNKLVAEYAQGAKNVSTIDASTPLLKDGLPQPELYGSDKLHFNAEGNKQWCAILKPVLEKVHGVPEPADKK